MKSTKEKEPVKVLTEAEKVDDYMEKLVHPLKQEIEAVRKIIKSNKKLSEKMRWSDPAYYYKEDLITFNLHNNSLVHLIFDNPAVANINSKLLEPSYRDKKMVYFDSMKSIQANKKELVSIINALVKEVDKK
jgi:hypothetical protein